MIIITMKDLVCIALIVIIVVLWIVDYFSRKGE